MSYSRFLTAAFVAALASAAAIAQSPKMQGGGMMRADTNGDGMISKAEAEAQAGVRFDRMDANHDGVLTPDELQGPGARMLQRDADASGKITRAAFIARADQRFERLDANHDGMLSADELKAGMDRARAAMDHGDAPPPPPPPPAQ